MAKRLGLRSGHMRSAYRRTIIDDRTGIVIDISQAGPDDDRRSVYVEFYAYDWRDGLGGATIERIEGLPHAAVTIRRDGSDA